MKKFLSILMILFCSCLLAQDHSMHNMTSPNSKMDRSNEPVDHSQMQMDHSQGIQHQSRQEMDQHQMHQQDMQKQKESPRNEGQRLPKGILKYPSVMTPNVGSLPWTMDGDVKVFHLIAEPLRREFAPGFWVNCWGYNGSSPGPTIEAVEGDRVRILVTNKLNEPTSVHWHGIILPNGMDGVAGLNQRAIPPGDTFKYEFTLKQNGTFMYHPHADEMVQIALGMMGFFIIHPKDGDSPPIDRDFALFLHEWRIPISAKTPIPFEMTDFNLFTFNSVLYPQIESLVVKKGERVRIRFANVMMSIHPIHIHGHEFTVTRRGAKRLPISAQYTENTVTVAPGETRDIEFIADNPGDWALHCHLAHHVMNQMEHDLPNLTGINKGKIDDRIRKYFPDFMGLMGINGMGEMFEMYGTNQNMMGMTPKLPKNISPIAGNPGPFGPIEMGGMFTIFKVRENLTSYADPGWYRHPPGTVAESINYSQHSQHNGSDMQHRQGMDHSQMQNMEHNKYRMQQSSINHQGMQVPHDMSKVNWVSQMNDKDVPHSQEGTNWMQSKPEDSMGGHGGMSGHQMKAKHQGNMNQGNATSTNQMQHMGH
jgi:hypothetical protein